MKLSLRILLIFLLVVTALHFSTKSLASEEASQPLQGESDLSKHPWQVGVFAQGGFPPDYRINIIKNSNYGFYYNLKSQLFSAGLEAGRQTRRFEGPMPLRGRGEVMLEITPFWMARYPSQIVSLLERSPTNTTVVSTGPWNGEDFHGASVTPFLLRWNFSQRDSARVVPWAQLGGGLLWTNHKFPLSYYGGTSVINFTPQVGAGVNIFNRSRHSVNFAIKAIHISNASLGDHNPGLNITLQFSAGYSWWK